MFSRSILMALLSATLALAQSSANPFKIPTNFSATAGQPLTLNWTPTTSGTVSLVLRSGASSDLTAGTLIAGSIDNSGSYTWTPDTMITRGSDYTVEIVSDSSPSDTNYTPYFVIDSDNTVAYSTSDVSLGAPSSTVGASSTASATGSATSVTAALSSASASSASAAATASSGAATTTTATTAAAGSTTSGASSTSSGSSASSGSMTSSGSMATSASSAASSASQSVASITSGSGARATAVVGMFGMAAVGAVGALVL